MTLPPTLTQACRQGRLLGLWGALPLALAARPPANRAQALNQWAGQVAALPPLAEPLAELPPLPLLSLDPTTQVEQVFRQAGVSLAIVAARREVPPVGFHTLFKLAGDLPTRTGVILSRAELQEFFNDPDKRHLLAEARRIVQTGAVLLLGSDPANPDFQAWWTVLRPALGQPPAFAVGEPPAPWPEGVTGLGLDLAAVNAALWAASTPLEITPLSKGDLDVSKKDNAQKLLDIHEHRLQKLKEQQASFGLHTPPYISMEIEQVTAEINKLRGQLGLPLLEPDSQAATPPAQTPQGPPPAGDVTYNINIQQASGVAIGNQAQVTQQGRAGSSPPAGDESTRAAGSREQRCADLAENIRETQALIKEYEDQRRLAEDPKVKRRTEREIKDLQHQLATAQAEWDELGCGSNK